jgi:hypothetical protein
MIPIFPITHYKARKFHSFKHQADLKLNGSFLVNKKVVTYFDNINARKSMAMIKCARVPDS